MPHAATTDPVLARFRTAVTDLYGDRLTRVVLYGSRARGDHQPDSDYDIAVFLNDLPNRAIEMRRLADIETGILPYRHGGRRPANHAFVFARKGVDARPPSA
jgi:hypothetical protein